MNFPNEMSGTHPLAGWCNKLLRAAKASRISNGIGYKTRIGSDGTILEVNPGGAGGGESAVGVVMYKIKSFQGDYMTCRLWDGITEGATDVYVAKPTKLRNSQTVVALDGVNITYVYDGGTLMRAATHPNFQSDVQKIIPRYLVNDIIYVADVVNSLTGAGVVTTTGAVVTKIDVNVDGRYWARL